MSLQQYGIKPYSQIINDMSREKIKFDDLIKEFNLEKGSDQLSRDSPLMKFLSILPGKDPQRKVYPRVSLICLGLLICEGSDQDKAEVLFSLLDPEHDQSGALCLTLSQWLNSEVFEIIVQIALKVKPDSEDEEVNEVIKNMKTGGQFKSTSCFTSLLFGKKKKLKRNVFIQTVVNNDQLNWLFTIPTIQDQFSLIQGEIGFGQSVYDDKS